MRVPPASLLIILFVATTPAFAQSLPPGAPVPPGSLGGPAPTIYVPPYPGRTAASRVDPVTLQREAKQLLELSQSVQPDIESLRRGLLSKDLLDKLKRIEKLSKHLREQVAPLAQ
jgi:hypothetical protein